MRDHRAVVGEDVPPLDSLLLEQGPPVRGVRLQRARVEHRPVRGEAEEQRVEEQDEAEELDDLTVHSAAPASACNQTRRRDLSETIKRSASRTKFATIELPP